jgi:gliding motility-associated-like protein
VKVFVGFVFCIVFGFSSTAFGQSSSNKGTNFWLAYVGHIDGKSSRMTLFLSSDVNTTYSVKAGNTVFSSGTITANQVKAVFIDPNQVDVYIGTSNTVESGKGIEVTTADPISVYCILSNNARTGGTLVLPTAALEQEYYVFSEQNTGNSNIKPYSQFTVLATTDNTVLEITPKQTDRAGARLANTTFQVTLNKGEIYQYQAVDDLTGSHIRSISGCAPIAVFSGSTWTAYCEASNSRKASGGDNLLQQLFPVTAWGRNFVSSPFFNTQNGNTDVIKIIVAEDNTTVSVNGSTTNANGTSLSNPYSKGSVIRFFTQDPMIIKASSPIAVAQYQTSQTCNYNNDANASNGGPFLGDPEMTVLNPIEQTLKDITVYSKLGSVPGVNTNILKYYLNIIIKTADIVGFTLDGMSISTLFKAIGDGEYSYAVVDVTNSSAQHRLMAAGGFTAIAYGYGQVESYAYLAGTDLKNLKSNIQIFKTGASTAATNFCLGSSFNFQMRLPYKTDKVTWNLNNGAYVETVNNPAFTTTIEDGTTYFLYNYTLAPSNFTQPGKYTISAVILKPSTANCLQDEKIFSTFDLFAPEIAMPASACVNTDVQIKDNSPQTGGNIKTWLWDFGDGITSTLQNPIHKFSTFGVKTIRLTVTTDLGCTQSTSKQINILAAPKADFTITGSLCINAPLTFTSTSTAVNSDIQSQLWDFGNGTPNVQTATANTTFSTAGIYKVKLITISSAGCADTIVKNIEIVNPPSISFDDPGSCVSDLVSFEAKSISGNVATWLWDFGDGSNDLTQKNLAKPKHKYTAAGTYVVKLSAVSVQGCTTEFSRTIVISGNNPTTVFAIKNDKICANEPLVVVNNSTIGFGKITKIDWIYDYQVGGANVIEADLSPSFGKEYQHTYPNLSITKTYQVVMRAYSGQLCFAETAPKSVTVYAAPIVEFSNINPVCENNAPFQLVAKDLNSTIGQGVFSGSGVTASGIFSPSQVGPGNYPITYTYTNNKGCADKKTITITVTALPSVNVPSEINILWGGQMQIAATALGTKMKIKWSPADGLSSDSVISPIASPKQTTNYTLTISTGTCELTANVLVNVHDQPNIPNVFSPNGDAKNDTWVIKYLETLPHAKISIFNRFGQQVFTASPYTHPWDGKLNGKDIPVGVYYYILEPNNGRKKYSGSITVLR